MFSVPSIADVIEGIQVSLQNDIMPEVHSQNAQVAVVMIQAMLQTLVQRYPVEQQLMAAEHNEMAAVLRDVAGMINGSTCEAATAVRKRGESLGARPDYAPIPTNDDIVASHRELSDAIIATMTDLDAMIREGDEAAERALARVRKHATARTVQEFGIYTIGAGMAGRG